MKIFVAFTIDGESPPEPTSFLDIATLVIICQALLLMICMAICSKMRQRTFFPLRSVTGVELFVLIFFGAVDMFSTLIANEQISQFIQLRRVDCALWSFWLQYPFGIAVLFVFVIRRMLHKTYNFHKSISLLPIHQKRLLHNWIVMLIMLPILVLCLCVTLSKASHFDENVDACVTNYREKMLLCLWAFSCASASIIMSIALQKGIGKTFISEWRPIRRIVICVAIVLIINLIINIMGLIRYSAGRSIFTLSRVFLHLFCMSMLMGKNIWLSFKMNDEYTQNVLNSYMAYDISIWSIHELSKSPKLMDQFIRYCSQKITGYAESSDTVNDTPRQLNAKKMADCYHQIQRWKNQRHIIEKTASLAQAKSIINDHMKDLEIPKSISDHVIAYQDELPDNIFVKLEQQLLDDFQLAWGQEYLSERNQNALNARYADEDSMPLDNIMISRRQLERLNYPENKLGNKNAKVAALGSIFKGINLDPDDSSLMKETDD